ncbi:hypothetical protein DDZ13_14945 [Coraliomargarita sinensis]|uniref:Leucine-rich repeat domain-containing protein n=1 Tax=Coraliomargarita sinensis TaxID=2174842 RepID=A0A317ZCJ2_9BACT|nr:leucine-rich repeat domain-containing protein [Coraliomargarita sinensis]PXA02865.1 hypothetical protein DDZ13_14945 [Coraliomargarita sinensis]
MNLLTIEVPQKSILFLVMAICLNAGHGATFQVEGTNIVLTYQDGGSPDTVAISDCNTDASGELLIPSIIGGKNVTSIGDRAFYDCDQLTSVVIPETVDEIGEWAFFRCYSLASASLPDNITTIRLNTFRYCRELDSITIPDSVTTIGEGAFAGCSKLSEIVIPTNVTSIGSSAFHFAGLTSVSLPSGLTDVGYLAFGYCQKLTEIYIPDTVLTIGESAFNGCRLLEDVRLPSGLKVISERMFEYCESLTSVDIPNTVEAIETRAFAGCSKLETIHIPSNVTSIEGAPFAQCTSLTSITVAIENLAFSSIGGVLFDKNGTTLIGYPSGRTGGYSFDENVTAIGDLAFYRCTNLTSIVFPQNLNSIGASAFAYCTSLTDLQLPESLITIGRGGFSDCTSLRIIELPGGLTVVSEELFRGCSSLREVILPEGITNIGGDAFSYCSSLSSIIIPDSMNQFDEGSNPFSECYNLKNITFEGDAPTSSEELFFDDQFADLTIYFYESADGFTEPEWLGAHSYEVSGPDADSDGDNFGHRLETLLGTNPRDGSDRAKAWLTLENDNLKIHYAPHREHLNFSVQETTDISDPEGWANLDSLSFTGDYDEQTAEISGPRNGSTFYRVSVTQK